MPDGERLFALLMVIADIVGSIQCRDCRKVARRSVKKLLPDFHEKAMKRPVLVLVGGADHVH